MTASWPENTNWNGSGGCDLRDGGGDATTGGSGSTISWSLTSQVQAIVNGGTNNGWAIGDRQRLRRPGLLRLARGRESRRRSALTYYP